MDTPTNAPTVSGVHAAATRKRLAAVENRWKGGNRGAVTADDVDWLICEVARLQIEIQTARAEGVAEHRTAVQSLIDRGLAAGDEHAAGYKRGLDVSRNLVTDLRRRIDEVFRWYDLARTPGTEETQS